MDEIGIDPMVLLFTLIISVLSGVLFSLIPVLRFGTPSAAALKEGGRRRAMRRAAPDAQHVVVSEVALAVVRWSSRADDSDVRRHAPSPARLHKPRAVQTFRLDMPQNLISDLHRSRARTKDSSSGWRKLPGVVSVGLSSSITMDGEDNGNPLFVEQVQVPDGEFHPSAASSLSPLATSRRWQPHGGWRPSRVTDIHQLRPVVIISENLAREYWQEPSRALGKRVRNGRQGPWQEIVGVVGNERDDGLNHPATSIVYWPMVHASYPRRTMAFAVRSSRVGAPGFVRELQQAVWSVNSNLPLAAVQTLDEIRADSMAQTSFTMVMLAIAASVALLLGVVGIYGVIAYIATQRIARLVLAWRSVRRLETAPAVSPSWLVLTLTVSRWGLARPCC